MTRKWKPQIAGIAQGCAQWLRMPQPRTGQFSDGDADGRRTSLELDAIRARFPDRA
jgi:hypothetical protein